MLIVEAGTLNIVVVQCMHSIYIATELKLKRGKKAAIVFTKRVIGLNVVIAIFFYAVPIVFQLNPFSVGGDILVIASVLVMDANLARAVSQKYRNHKNSKIFPTVGDAVTRYQLL